MNKTDFIGELAKKAGISTEQASSVNGIFDNINILKAGNKGEIIAQIGAKLGMDAAKSKEIYEAAYGILGDGILSKIKNPFG